MPKYQAVESLSLTSRCNGALAVNTVEASLNVQSYLNHRVASSILNFRRSATLHRGPWGTLQILR